jgi:hypothetical protein
LLFVWNYVVKQKQEKDKEIKSEDLLTLITFCCTSLLLWIRWCRNTSLVIRIGGLTITQDSRKHATIGSISSCCMIDYHSNSQPSGFPNLTSEEKACQVLAV